MFRKASKLAFRIRLATAVMITQAKSLDNNLPPPPKTIWSTVIIRGNIGARVKTFISSDANFHFLVSFRMFSKYPKVTEWKVLQSAYILIDIDQLYIGSETKQKIPLVAIYILHPMPKTMHLKLTTAATAMLWWLLAADSENHLKCTKESVMLASLRVSWKTT